MRAGCRIGALNYWHVDVLAYRRTGALANWRVGVPACCRACRIAVPSVLRAVPPLCIIIIVCAMEDVCCLLSSVINLI